jgi:MerR family Zn(II)-responsive transcriptional regulator of zntA
MLIKELSNRTGVSIDTIRFYEKQGLLDETHFERSENHYRHYSEQAFNRLQLIKMGQCAGFTLSEMREAIHAWETDELTPEEKELHLFRKLEEIDQKMAALEKIKAYLHAKIDSMQEQRHPADLLSAVK